MSESCFLRQFYRGTRRPTCLFTVAAFVAPREAISHFPGSVLEVLPSVDSCADAVSCFNTRKQGVPIHGVEFQKAATSAGFWARYLIVTVRSNRLRNSFNAPQCRS